MEGPKKNKFEDLSADERQKVVWMEMQAQTIRDYALNNDVNPVWVLEFDQLLNEAYEGFLLENNSEKLRPYCFDFMEMIKAAEQKFAFVISNQMKSYVNGKYTLSEDQVHVWRSLIMRINEKIIPRQKKLGLDLSVKTLEGAIMQSEIKISNDVEG